MQVISLEDVCKTYFMGDNQVHALRNVSFSIEEGEFVSQWRLRLNISREELLDISNKQY